MTTIFDGTTVVFWFVFEKHSKFPGQATDAVQLYYLSGGKPNYLSLPQPPPKVCTGGKLE